MSDDRSTRTTRPAALASLLGIPAQQAFNLLLSGLSLAESQARRIAPTATAVGVMLQTAARQSARNPLAATNALAGAVASGMAGALGRIGALVEPHMTQALNALQIPTAGDVKGLARRVEELNATVQDLAASQPPAPKARTAKRAPARKKRSKRRSSTSAS